MQAHACARADRLSRQISQAEVADGLDRRFKVGECTFELALRLADSGAAIEKSPQGGQRGAVSGGLERAGDLVDDLPEPLEQNIILTPARHVDRRQEAPHRVSRGMASHFNPRLYRTLRGREGRVPSPPQHQRVDPPGGCMQSPRRSLPRLEAAQRGGRNAIGLIQIPEQGRVPRDDRVCVQPLGEVELIDESQALVVELPRSSPIAAPSRAAGERIQGRTAQLRITKLLGQPQSLPGAAFGFRDLLVRQTASGSTPERVESFGDQKPCSRFDIG